PVRTLVELRVATEHDHAFVRRSLRAEREGRTDRDREAVSERTGRGLDAGNLVPIRVRAERVAPLEEPGQDVFREEPLRGEDGVVRARAVTLAEDEPVAGLVARRGGVHVEHAVVQDPERVERRRAALVVLLVAGRERHELAYVIEVGAGRHRGDGTTSRALDVKRTGTTALSRCRRRP